MNIKQTIEKLRSLIAVVVPGLDIARNTTVASLDADNDELSTYRFNGSTWVLLPPEAAIDVFELTPLTATDAVQKAVEELRPNIALVVRMLERDMRPARTEAAHLLQKKFGKLRDLVNP